MYEPNFIQYNKDGIKIFELSLNEYFNNSQSQNDRIESFLRFCFIENL